MAQDLSSDPLQNLHCNVMKTWPTEDGKDLNLVLLEPYMYGFNHVLDQ